MEINYLILASGGGYFKWCQRIRNRWARKIAPGIHPHANVCRGTRICGNGYNLVVEEHASLGINSEIGSDLFIGEYTMMGPNCTIMTENHKFNATEDSFDGYEAKAVSVGHHSWIGKNVIILPGAQIGHHCIIGAGSVVPGKYYPDYSLIAGNPAIVKKRII